MTHKTKAPPVIPAGYYLVNSRPAIRPGGATVEEYASTPLDETALQERLCAWLEKWKGENP